MSTGTMSELNCGTRRPRGRPRVEINLDAVADAVAELFAAGGEEAVTIPDAAERMGVSRATLYRTVPTRERLMGLLLERSTRELTYEAKKIIREVSEPRDQLESLTRLLTREAIRRRHYLPALFGAGELPSEVAFPLLTFARDFERLWVGVVAEAMRVGELAEADPVLTARLLLGQCIWVSQWYRPTSAYSEDIIGDAAIRLLPGRARPSASRNRSPVAEGRVPLSLAK